MTRLLLAVVIFLSSIQVQAAKATKIVYAAPTTVAAAVMYIANINGYFKAQGIEVEEKLFSSGREAMDALLAGQAQLQSVSETPLVLAVLQGNNVVTIATTSAHEETKLIARRDRGIQKETDLKGKKVATAPGTNSDYFMYVFLKGHGLSKKDIKVFNMKAPEMKTALVTGDIDAYFAWEPHIYYAKKELGDKAIVFNPGARYHGRHTVNMNADFVKKNPETVRKIVRALLQAEEFIRKNPEKAQELVAAKLKVDRVDLAQMWREIDFKVQLDEGVLPLYQKIGHWFAEINKREAPLPDFKQHIYSKALLEERKSAVAPDLQ